MRRPGKVIAVGLAYIVTLGFNLWRCKERRNRKRKQLTLSSPLQKTNHHQMIRVTIALLLTIGTLKCFAQQDKLPDWALGPFIRPEGVNPIISPDTTKFLDPLTRKRVDWESNDVFNPAAAVKDGKVYVPYRAEDRSGTGIGGRTSRIGLAQSNDGITVERRSTPVLYPTKDAQLVNERGGGCEDPRVAVTPEGTYLMLYTQWNRKVPQLAAATSKDLVHWVKAGPVFRKAYGGLFKGMVCKSASIITKVVDGKQVITKINGKYFIYWGELNVYGATSTDLVNWQPLINKDSSLRILFSPRKGYFDSHLTECGPPAVMTDKGIVLLYNGKNKGDETRDTDYTANTYAAGQALFDKADPTKFITRLDKPYFKPEAPFEKSGQYPAGTVFTEGLVYYKNKWFMYYGCADSRVAVAIYNPADSVEKTAGNPVIDGWYADPEGAVFGKQYWLYPTYSDKYARQVFFDVFSSTDMTTWTKHEHVLDTNAVRWAKYAMWAPAIVQKDSKYYFFFTANDIQNDSAYGGIGVAVADRPEGPFKDYLGKPLLGKFYNGAQPIDQFVFKDKDGKYYMIYGGWGHCNIARLKDDFTGFIPYADGTTFKEITPQDYVEGPFMFIRNGKYYFMWSEGGWTGPDYKVAYAIADSPFGPFKRIGTVLQQDTTIANGAGHNSVIQKPGTDEYFIVYHRRPHGETAGNHRATCIDKMEFDEKGLIKPVKITREGVGRNPL